MTAYAKNSPGAPVGRYVKGDTVTDSAGIVWVCVVTGNPAQFDVQGADGAVIAADVTYDNVASGLAAENVQDAVDEVYAAIPVGGGGDIVAFGTTAAHTGTTAETVLATIPMPALAVGDMILLSIAIEASIAVSESATLAFRANDPVTGGDLGPNVVCSDAAAHYTRDFMSVITATPGDATVFSSFAGIDGEATPVPVIQKLNVFGSGIDVDAPWNMYIVVQLTDAGDVFRLTHYTVRALVAS